MEENENIINEDNTEDHENDEQLSDKEDSTEDMEDNEIINYVEVPENYYENMINLQAGQLFCNSLITGLLISIALIIALSKRK